MPFKRIQLFEFNDHALTPAVLRDTIVETLSHALEQGRMLAGLAPVVHRFLETAGTREVLDLCSGAGGPARILCQEMARLAVPPLRMVLTDLYPRPTPWEAARHAFPEHIDFIAEEVDATRIPAALSQGRARVVINAFHHFPPSLASAILADAVHARAPFFIAECFERGPLGFAPFLLSAPLLMLSAPLRSVDRRLERALLTWITPVALLAGLWDGLVSTMRVYTEAELRAMVEPLGQDYDLEYGRFPLAPFGRGYYFFGVPRG